jgi:hypothetical protein
MLCRPGYWLELLVVLVVAAAVEGKLSPSFCTGLD